MHINSPAAVPPPKIIISRRWALRIRRRGRFKCIGVFSRYWLYNDVLIIHSWYNYILLHKSFCLVCNIAQSEFGTSWQHLDRQPASGLRKLSTCPSGLCTALIAREYSATAKLILIPISFFTIHYGHTDLNFQNTG